LVNGKKSNKIAACVWAESTKGKAPKVVW